LGPLVIQPERNTSLTAAMVASSMVGRENGRKGRGEVMEFSGNCVVNKVERILCIICIIACYRWRAGVGNLLFYQG
jgi:hypothetical protein